MKYAKISKFEIKYYFHGYEFEKSDVTCKVLVQNILLRKGLW